MMNEEKWNIKCFIMISVIIVVLKRCFLKFYDVFVWERWCKCKRDSGEFKIYLYDEKCRFIIWWYDMFFSNMNLNNRLKVIYVFFWKCCDILLYFLILIVDMKIYFIVLEVICYEIVISYLNKVK